ncbi:hypothetical protein K461DRAFT_297149 [Myriangium duriaei CBS 260.36]|uniref:Ig-like domain-containing protein n=1 Tax=Myriangium duriaei CBS 260.36 TaxID=1168546 RepID=A0A9P4MI98_9PEZI|nr:hypothetical protein K461DRAFT_297149 [Myriangium duriaei CBS 260.36]
MKTILLSLGFLGQTYLAAATSCTTYSIQIKALGKDAVHTTCLRGNSPSSDFEPTVLAQVCDCVLTAAKAVPWSLSTALLVANVPASCNNTAAAAIRNEYATPIDMCDLMGAEPRGLSPMASLTVNQFYNGCYCIKNAAPTTTKKVTTLAATRKFTSKFATKSATIPTKSSTKLGTTLKSTTKLTTTTTTTTKRTSRKTSSTTKTTTKAATAGKHTTKSTTRTMITATTPMCSSSPVILLAADTYATRFCQGVLQIPASTSTVVVPTQPITMDTIINTVDWTSIVSVHDISTTVTVVTPTYTFTNVITISTVTNTPDVDFYLKKRTIDSSSLSTPTYMNSHPTTYLSAACECVFANVTVPAPTVVTSVVSTLPVSTMYTSTVQSVEVISTKLITGLTTSTSFVPTVTITQNSTQPIQYIEATNASPGGIVRWLSDYHFTGSSFSSGRALTSIRCNQGLQSFTANSKSGSWACTSSVDCIGFINAYNKIAGSTLAYSATLNGDTRYCYLFAGKPWVPTNSGTWVVIGGDWAIGVSAGTN